MKKGFKEFAFKGNVVDMAVGVIIGGAFSTIVASLVGDIITPLIGMLFHADFSQLFVTLKGPDGAFFPNLPTEIITMADAQAAGFITLSYGAFLTAVVNFLIIAGSLYLVITGISKAASAVPKKKKAEVAPAPPTTKNCPFCCTEIAIAATRCPHCTSSITSKE